MIPSYQDPLSLEDPHFTWLTPLQVRFVYAWTRDPKKTPKEHLISLGVDPKKAGRAAGWFLRNKHVRHAIQVETKKVLGDLKIDKRWILDRMIEEADPGVMEDSTPGSRVNALKALAKYAGMEDRFEEKAGDKVIVNIEGVTKNV